MFSNLLQRIKDLPNSIKAILGLLSTIIPTVILLRNNFSLAVVVVGAIILLASLSFFAHVMLARRGLVPGFTPSRGEIYEYPRLRPWALGALCLITLAAVLLFVYKPTRYYIIAALKGVEVAPRAEILIAEFDSRKAAKPFEIPKRIRDNLKDELARNGLKEVRVETTTQSIASEKEAKALAEQAESKVLVWGWYDDWGVTVNIYTPEPPSSGETMFQMKEIRLTKDPQAVSELSLQIQEQLPNDITFLSLFVIGSLEYQKNNYEKGHRAFDAAMASLPKEIRLKNESLLHFFSARSLGFFNNKVFDRAICEYSKAIELNPTFAAAYNNLGILLTRLYLDPPKEDEGPNAQTNSEVMPECLAKAGYTDELSVDTPDFFFAKALGYQPDSAVIQFNRVASKWSMADVFQVDERDKRAELAAMLDSLLSRDQSIPGAHILRGLFAFENLGNYFNKSQSEVARKEFSLASQLMPRSSELHINLGKVFVREGKLAEARAEFETSLAQSQSSEAHLALADVAIRERQTAVALQHLGSVKPGCKECDSAVRTAAVVKARLQFEAGNVADAIQTLEDNLSQQPEPVIAESDRGSEAAEYARNLTALTHYLLGLLYTLNSDAGKASAHFMKAKGPDPTTPSVGPVLGYQMRQAFSHNDTLAVAWYEICSRCLSAGMDSSSWGTTSQCLPRDVKQRLKVVFGILQDYIPHRVFYQREVEYAGLG